MYGNKNVYIEKIIFLIVRPEVLIIISSFVLLTFKTQNIPAKKKQNGKISNNIFGKFKVLNKNIIVVLIFSIYTFLLPYIFLVFFSSLPILIMKFENRVLNIKKRFKIEFKF